MLSIVKRRFAVGWYKGHGRLAVTRYATLMESEKFVQRHPGEGRDPEAAENTG
jgi:hypothetical protein